MIGKSVGRYRIIEEIGSGGMGVVYRARDERLERDVALKVLPEGRLEDEAARKRFIHEAKALSRLNHPNIATVHDFDTDGGVDFLVMEHIPGQSLEERLSAGALPEDDIMRLGLQLAEGLAAAHERGVIHRDLKPGNVRITPDGRLKILDFGIAALLRPVSDTATTDFRLTEARAVVGTLPYMAPEQLRSEPADRRTDIYAAGAVLYEMATGRRPFVETGAPQLITAILQKTPPDPSETNREISPRLEGIILKLLEKERERRHQSARELLEELVSLTSSAEQTVVPSPPPFLKREEEPARAEKPVFVARVDELAKLGELLDSALSGRGRVAFVTGEAGSGKTALVAEFVRQAQETHEDLIVAIGNCNAHTGIGDPYLPFREALGVLTGDVESRWTAGAITTEHATRLWHCLPVSVQAVAEIGADLIDTFVNGSALVHQARACLPRASSRLVNLEKLVEQRAAHPVARPQQSVLFEQYTRLLQWLAQQMPVLLVLDDLQWADAGSIGLLLHMCGRIEGNRLLVVGTYRSDEVALGRDGQRHPLSPVVNDCKRLFGNIEIELGRAGNRELVNAYLDSHPNRLSEAFREAFYRHTEGHPLFTVELFQGMQEQGVLERDDEGKWVDSEVLDWAKLPARVEATIGERIERLPNELREILGLASIEGESFTTEVLARVQKSDERALVRLLSGELDKRHHLVSAQGVQRVDTQRLSRYRFRHILFQKYLYGKLDEVERAYLHEDVGTALEAFYKDRAEEIAVQLARHFDEAGLSEKAIQYLKRAGEKATRLSANEEAAAHFSRALELLNELPDFPERARQELALQLALAAPIHASRGYGAHELGRACTRAWELCQEMGETPELFPALWLLWDFRLARAEHHRALELAGQILNLAERVEDPLQAALAHLAVGNELMYLGDFAAARDHLEKLVRFYDPKEHGYLAFVYGQDLGLTSFMWLSWTLWFQGYPDQAMKRAREALELARELDHPFTLAFVLSVTAVDPLLRRDDPIYRDRISELTRLATENGFAFFQARTMSDQGFDEVCAGRSEEGLAQMRQGLDVLRAMGAEFHRPHFLAWLAEALARAGKPDEGLEVLSEALSFVERTGECYLEAELHRLKGELLLMKEGSESAAEASFHRAIDIAERQRAKSLELRAVTSLARLWGKRGKTEDARKRLAKIYGWFTEGFDSPDLKDAKALLDELESAREPQ